MSPVISVVTGPASLSTVTSTWAEASFSSGARASASSTCHRTGPAVPVAPLPSRAASAGGSTPSASPPRPPLPCPGASRVA